MKERCVNCSCLSVAIVIVAFLCDPTEQRPQCVLPADCAENSLEVGVFHPRSPGAKLLPDVDDPTAIKQLMEMLLKQHNEYAEAYRIDHDEEENSTEKPPTANEPIHQLDAVQNPVPYMQFEENTTERTPNFVKVHTTENNKKENSTKKMSNESSNTNTEKRKYHPISMKSNQNTNGDNDSFWEVTTIEPLQLASPLLIDEYHFETTTIPPEPIQQTTQNGQVNLTNQIPVNSTNLNNTTPNIANIPPTEIDYMRNTNRTTTQSPHVILGPQQSDTIIDNPTSSLLSLESLEKITTKSTVKPQSDEKISSLFQPDQKQKLKQEHQQEHQQEQEQHHHQNVGGGIQLETLNRPISTSKLLATSTPASPVVGGATAAVKEIATNIRPGKNPIDVIPESIVKQEYQLSVAPAAGIGNKPSVSPSGGKRPNPIPNSAASSESEAEDYLISQLASIVGDGEETDDDEEENLEKGNEGNSSDDEEGEYLTDSEEEIEERENFDYLNSGDASDVISSVIEEVSSLI